MADERVGVRPAVVVGHQTAAARVAQLHIRIQRAVGRVDADRYHIPRQRREAPEVDVARRRLIDGRVDRSHPSPHPVPAPRRILRQQQRRRIRQDLVVAPLEHHPRRPRQHIKDLLVGIAPAPVAVAIERVTDAILQRRICRKAIVAAAQRPIVNEEPDAQPRRVRRRHRQMVEHVVGRIEDAIGPRLAQIPRVPRVGRRPVEHIGHPVPIAVRRQKLQHRAHRCRGRTREPLPTKAGVHIRPVVGGAAAAREARVPIRVRHRLAATPHPRPLDRLIRYSDPKVAAPPERLLQPELLCRIVDAHHVPAQRLRLRLRGGPRDAAVGDPIVVPPVAPHPRVDRVHRGRIHVLTDADRERADDLRRAAAVRRQARHRRQPRRHQIRFIKHLLIGIAAGAIAVPVQRVVGAIAQSRVRREAIVTVGQRSIVNDEGDASAAGVRRRN